MHETEHLALRDDGLVWLTRANRNLGWRIVLGDVEAEPYWPAKAFGPEPPWYRIELAELLGVWLEFRADSDAERSLRQQEWEGMRGP